MGEVALPDVPSVPAPSAGGGSAGSFYEELAKHHRVTDDLGESRGELPVERDARRLGARLPPGYVPKSGADLTFDPRLAYELALEVEAPSAVFARYGMSEADAAALIAKPAFVATIQRYREEIQASGVSFRLKAKIQAEDLLTHSYILATDPETPSAVRADLIKWTARMADLEPKQDKNAGTGGGFSLNITFAGAAPEKVVGEVIDGDV